MTSVQGAWAGGLASAGICSNAWREASGDCLHIGLINNMPGAALQATERQFRALLGAAAKSITVRLSFFALPEVPRSDRERRHIDTNYSCVNKLWGQRLDGVIVTGADPRCSDLRHEPFWESLTRLVDWAEHGTASAIWSCLAAHAAILHLDGIERRPLKDKLSGVFECRQAAPASLTANTPDSWRIPHSRWNEVSERALIECGYSILTSSPEAGADTFVRRGKSLFVFFQGHPEYDADSLSIEYRRDIRRFLHGEKKNYPGLPQNCFDLQTERLFGALQQQALDGGGQALLDHITAAIGAARVVNAWRPAAVAFYRNWLQYLVARKEARLENGRARIACR